MILLITRKNGIFFNINQQILLNARLAINAIKSNARPISKGNQGT